MGGQRGLTGRASFFIFPVRFAGVAQLVEHFLAKEDVASSSLVTRSLFLHVKDRLLPILLTVVVCLFAAACDRQAAETKPEVPADEAIGVVEEAVEVVEIMEPSADGVEAPSATLMESTVEPMSAGSLPGLYRDPSVPDVLYEFGENEEWQATWQPGDESRGLMMSGVYQVETGGVLHLRVLSFGRRESFLGDDWERRSPPHPRPRGYFRIEGQQLVMMSNKTAQAFTMAPFTAARLVRVEK